MKRTVILLNGPPGSGKDTAANFLKSRLLHPRLRKFATHVKEGTHAILGLVDHHHRPLPHDHFESSKNLSLPEFYGMTPRQAYIWFSEEVMKPKFGKAVFGAIEARKIVAEESPQDYYHALYIFSDSGFADEAREIVKLVGAENVFLFNIHRAGCTFAGDSRSYITHEDIGIPEANRNQAYNDGLDLYLDEMLERVVAIWKRSV